MSKIQFIELMKTVMIHKPKDNYDLTNGLLQLFREIDLNDDK